MNSDKVLIFTSISCATTQFSTARPLAFVLARAKEQWSIDEGDSEGGREAGRERERESERALAIPHLPSHLRQKIRRPLKRHCEDPSTGRSNVTGTTPEVKKRTSPPN